MLQLIPISFDVACIFTCLPYYLCILTSLCIKRNSAIMLIIVFSSNLNIYEMNSGSFSFSKLSIQENIIPKNL